MLRNIIGPLFNFKNCVIFCCCFLGWFFKSPFLSAGRTRFSKTKKQKKTMDHFLTLKGQTLDHFLTLQHAYIYIYVYIYIYIYARPPSNSGRNFGYFPCSWIQDVAMMNWSGLARLSFLVLNANRELIGLQSSCSTENKSKPNTPGLDCQTLSKVKLKTMTYDDGPNLQSRCEVYVLSTHPASWSGSRNQ